MARGLDRERKEEKAVVTDLDLEIPVYPAGRSRAMGAFRRARRGDEAGCVSVSPCCSSPTSLPYKPSPRAPPLRTYMCRQIPPLLNFLAVVSFNYCSGNEIAC